MLGGVRVMVRVTDNLPPMMDHLSAMHQYDSSLGYNEPEP